MKTILTALLVLLWIALNIVVFVIAGIVACVVVPMHRLFCRCDLVV